MKWSNFTYSEFYIPCDENQKAIRGYWLTTLGLDLEKIPTILREPYYYYGTGTKNGKPTPQKIFLKDIVGTSHSDYGEMELIQAYMRIKRAGYYISNGYATRNKYFYALKQPVYKQAAPVTLSRLDNDKFFVNSNGNHRVILYKMMMLSEIALLYPYAYDDDFDFGCAGFDDIKKKYWLNAMVYE